MSLEIAPVADAGQLPVCTPFLMPFQISYNGFAPISRYLRPKPAPPPLAALSVQSSSTATLVASSSSTSMLSKSTSTSSAETSAQETDPGLSSNMGSAIDVINPVRQIMTAQPTADVDMAADSETQPTVGVTPLNTAPEGRTRLIAAFRGRQIYGQAVDIPSGYSGFVLRAPSAPQGIKEEVATHSKPLSRKAKPKSKTHLTTRQSRKPAKVDVSADEPEDGNNGDCSPDLDTDSLSVSRKLVPCSTFTSFMLWTPDRPLDEGRDEYVRALVEWTHLAAEIHSYDDQD